MPPLVPESEIEGLSRSRDFFLDRAEVRLEGPDPGGLRYATAAGLWREAASLTLLMGEVEEARHLFRRAGDAFVGLGLPAGLVLQQLSYGRAGSDGWTSGMSLVEATAYADEAKKPGFDELAPFRRAAVREPQQIWQAALALGMSEPQEGRHHHLSRLRDRLRPHHGVALGPTGVSLRRLVELLAAMTEETESVAASEVAAGDLFRDVVRRRMEMLETARTDRFHWERIQRPSALLDLDLTALTMVAMAHARSKAAVEALFDSPDSWVRLPLQAALALRPPPHSERELGALGERD